jgi:hypothetical protein
MALKASPPPASPSSTLTAVLAHGRTDHIISHHEGGAPMTTWKSDDLTRIGTADQLQLASLRRDGTLRNPVTIWVVRLGDDLYIRAVNGRTGAWFRGTQVRHEGRIQADGVSKDVTFADPDHDIGDQVDAAYRAKYGRYPARFLDPALAPQARAATLRLVPRPASP